MGILYTRPRSLQGKNGKKTKKGRPEDLPITEGMIRDY
jgi:hypothetical protein